MKLLFKFSILLVFFYTIFLGAFSVHATKPLPSSFVQETTIAGIVPVNDDDVAVQSATFELDFTGSSGIVVNKGIERSARLKMKYDLTYSGKNSYVRFTLPILDKLDYLNQDLRLMVDGVEVEPTLKIAPEHHFYTHHTFTKMLLEDSVGDYTENLLDDYDFVHDFDGYQYTVKNPKTKGSKYYAHTSIRFDDVSHGSIFVDGLSFRREGDEVLSYGRIYKSEEQFVFFSSSNASFEVESRQYLEIDGGYEGHGEFLDNAVVTTQEMSLSEYLNVHTFQEHRFLEPQKNIFYYTLDQRWNDNQSTLGFWSKPILSDVTQQYYEMSLEFDVDFYKPDVQVEIQLPIPIHSSRPEMVIEVVANPFQKMDAFGELVVRTRTAEKIVRTSEVHTQNDKSYEWSTDGDGVLQIVFENSSYNNRKSNLTPLLIIFVLLVTAALIYGLVFQEKKEK